MSERQPFYYTIDLKQGDLFIELSSDDVAFVAHQMQAWYTYLLDDTFVPVTIPEGLPVFDEESVSYAPSESSDVPEVSENLNPTQPVPALPEVSDADLLAQIMALKAEVEQLKSGASSAPPSFAQETHQETLLSQIAAPVTEDLNNPFEAELAQALASPTSPDALTSFEQPVDNVSADAAELSESPISDSLQSVDLPAFMSETTAVVEDVQNATDVDTIMASLAEATDTTASGAEPTITSDSPVTGDESSVLNSGQINDLLASLGDLSAPAAPSSPAENDLPLSEIPSVTLTSPSVITQPPSEPLFSEAPLSQSTEPPSPSEPVSSPKAVDTGNDMDALLDSLMSDLGLPGESPLPPSAPPPLAPEVPSLQAPVDTPPLPQKPDDFEAIFASALAEPTASQPSPAPVENVEAAFDAQLAAVFEPPAAEPAPAIPQPQTSEPEPPVMPEEPSVEVYLAQEDEERKRLDEIAEKGFGIPGPGPVTDPRLKNLTLEALQNEAVKFEPLFPNPDAPPPEPDPEPEAADDDFGFGMPSGGPSLEADDDFGFGMPMGGSSEPGPAASDDDFGFGMPVMSSAEDGITSSPAEVTSESSPPPVSLSSSPVDMDGLQVDSLRELCDMADKASTGKDYMILAGLYLSRFQSTAKYSLKDLNMQLVKSGLTPINHAILESTISEGLFAMVPDLTGDAQAAEYQLSESGLAFAQSLLG